MGNWNSQIFCYLVNRVHILFFYHSQSAQLQLVLRTDYRSGCQGKPWTILLRRVMASSCVTLQICFGRQSITIKYYRCGFVRLACIEIHLCLARLFSRFALNLFETDASSMKQKNTISASHGTNSGYNSIYILVDICQKYISFRIHISSQSRESKVYGFTFLVQSRSVYFDDQLG